MSIVTITLNNRTFKLSCPEESHTELHSLAKELDKFDKYYDKLTKASNDVRALRLQLGQDPM